MASRGAGRAAAGRGRGAGAVAMPARGPLSATLLLVASPAASAVCTFTAPEHGAFGGCPTAISFLGAFASGQLANGAACVPSCLAGYTLQGAFSCSAIGALDAIATCQPNPCSPPAGIEQAAEPPCVQTGLIASGGFCKAVCAAGYEPDVATLACSLGTLAPSTFKCKPKVCAAPLVADAANPACAEGASRAHGERCTPQCAASFQPSPKTLLCSLGVFEPRTFTCAPLGCSAPQGIPFAEAAACQEGSVVAHGSACTARCQPGYTAWPPSLACGLGNLSPASFDCLPSGCSAPSRIGMAAEPSCVEGAFIQSGGACTAKCAPGYYPTTLAMICFGGALLPDSFSCQPLPCSAPTGITDAGAQPCFEGSRINHGASCTAQCNVGYVPLPATLSCGLGALRPAGFSCQAETCVAPVGIPHTAVKACREGAGVMASGGVCTPQCLPGFRPSSAALRCSGGVWTPRTFHCEPEPCAAPVGVAQAPALTCRDGASIAHGSHCWAVCNSGYAPFPAVLSCGMGNLTPPTFTCMKSACRALEGIKNAAAVSCEEGQTVNDGGLCTPQCIVGYSPSVKSMSCLGQLWSPQSFECHISGCAAPVVANTPPAGSCAEGGLVGDGFNCSVRCAAGFAPSESLLACRGGNFTPPGFLCHALAAAAEEPAQVVMSVPGFVILFFVNICVAAGFTACVGWRFCIRRRICDIDCSRCLPPESRGARFFEIICCLHDVPDKVGAAGEPLTAGKDADPIFDLLKDADPEAGRVVAAAAAPSEDSCWQRWLHCRCCRRKGSHEGAEITFRTTNAKRMDEDDDDPSARPFNILVTPPGSAIGAGPAKDQPPPPPPVSTTEVAASPASIAAGQVRVIAEVDAGSDKSGKSHNPFDGEEGADDMALRGDHRDSPHSPTNPFGETNPFDEPAAAEPEEDADDLDNPFTPPAAAAGAEVPLGEAVGFALSEPAVAAASAAGAAGAAAAKSKARRSESFQELGTDGPLKKKKKKSTKLGGDSQSKNDGAAKSLRSMETE